MTPTESASSTWLLQLRSEYFICVIVELHIDKYAADPKSSAIRENLISKLARTEVHL